MAPENTEKTEFAAMFDDLGPAFAFLTRIPAGMVGGPAGAAPDFREVPRVFPLVGAVIGIAGGAVLAIAVWLGEPPTIAAALGVAATILLTGAMHEDGLADTADGFGGATSTEGKLEIMADSRIGAYGATALVLSILFRVAVLSGIAGTGGFRAALALIAAEAASRAAMVRLWHSLPAARIGGLSQAAGTPDQRAMLIAMAAAAVIVVVTVIPAFGVVAAIVASLVLALAAYAFIRLTSNQIGGQTGDTLGACQQVTAIAFLIGLAPFA
jgi:adenosylcobinamide-GDP ribazoletransferase